MSAVVVRHEQRDRFRVSIRGHELVVDQPAPASDDAGPTPTELFVASLAACAAFFARRFLARRGLPDAALSVRCGFGWAADHSRVDRIALHIEVPEPLPPDVEAGLLRAVDHCTVEASIRGEPVIEREVVIPSRLEEPAAYP